MPGLDPINVGSIVVAVVGAVSGWAAQRSSVKATRLTAEGEAYTRARKLDIETIERQDKEFIELETQYKKVKAELEQSRRENETLRIAKRALLNQVESLQDQMRGRRSG